MMRLLPGKLLPFSLLGIGMMIFRVGLIVLAVWVVVRIINSRPRYQPPASRPQETTREILDRRLAKGEITPEEYDRLRAQIEG